ncbi:hypothetical protein [Winogradskyella sp. UBA3174]|uniref:hypothetical protein n=1 Tax=Winogradskyella sp. UBA3174 TaxID=1947785 RepID=UPI0025D1BD9E|nr:hypothetical protein [Winogradskyella sp. UBA3174]|tara:strand:+ start:8902 stop:9153 length:252 start_codon:yes stop_codon:yes gene_type:complete
MSKIKLSCDEANHVCDKNQYKEAGIWEMLKLNLHLLYCRVCRKYTSRNMKLTKLVKTNKVEVLDKATKEKLQITFDKELAKQL